MESNVTKHIYTPFVLCKETICGIYNYLSENFDEVEVSAHCLDDTVRTFVNLDELIHYKNIPKAKIISH